MSNYQKYLIYEREMRYSREKRKLLMKNLTPAAYEDALKRLARKLGI